jgi:DNA-directed RNA polymerase specialized sigma24 family protein
MIINEATNKNNPFLKTIICLNTFSTLAKKEFHEALSEPEYDPQPDQEFEQTLDRVTAKLNNLFWYDKKIFELYMEFGSLRKVAAKTGIKYGAIHQTVQKVKQTIRNEANIINRPA